MNYTKHKNGMYTWPTLYKKGSTGKEQQWDIAVIPQRGTTADVSTDWASIRVEHGQVGGKIQFALQNIQKGKNLGKANSTTPEQQAVSEAEAKWVKQHDKGYSTERGGGSMELKPMLAKKYEDAKAKVTFPSCIQPKLDGVRCIAHKAEDGKVTLWSRLSKEHKGLNHIREALATRMRVGEVWDGELFVHKMPFQTVISLVKKDQPGSEKIQYHVYDLVDNRTFLERIDDVTRRLKADPHPSLVCVETVTIWSHHDVESYHEQCVSDGYEGAMLRVGDCSYKQGYRSSDLLKVKAFTDDEFEIIDVRNGIGKFEDKAVFICKTKEGYEFEACPKGTDEQRAQYWTDRAKLIGKMLTVKFFEWTTSDKSVPRFPIGLAVRDYE